MSSTMQNKASLPVIKRLPKYYRYLSNLQADGRDKISSSELARMMGTTASQVRQDFNCFGGFGQQGIGYKVDVLLTEIGKLLFGNGELLPTVLIGAGRLGTAVSSRWSPCCACRARAPWTFRTSWFGWVFRASGTSATMIFRSFIRRSQWKTSIWATA